MIIIETESNKLNIYSKMLSLNKIEEIKNDFENVSRSSKNKEYLMKQINDMFFNDLRNFARVVKKNKIEEIDLGELSIILIGV